MISLPVVVVWGLKATPLLLLVLLATLCLHRASAAHRHFLWTLGVVAALLMPGVSVFGPAVPVSWLAASFETVAPAPSPTLPPSPTSNTPRVTIATDELLPVTESRASTEAESAPVGRNRAPQSILPSLWYTVWIVGAFLTGLLLLVSLLGTWVVGRRARRVLSGPLLEEMERARRALGIKRPIRLLLARNETMPMTWGHWHPALLLPVSALSWSAARSRAVLLHELAHVQRSDWMIQLGARVANVLYWWNPLLWLAARRLRIEQELASDDLVLAQGTPAADYAHDLLEIAKEFRGAPVGRLAVVAMAHRSRLGSRLLALLDAARSRAPIGRAPMALTVLVALGVVIPSAGLRAVSATTTTGIAAEPEVPEGEMERPSTGAASIDLDFKPREGGPLPVQARSTLCDWTRKGESRSSMSNINDGRAEVRLEIDGCELHVRSRGEVTFSADEKQIESISSGGYFQVEERRGSERRRVEVNPGRGNVEWLWYVNGRETSWDQGAASWFAEAVLATFRHTSFQARERARRLLRTRGPQGLRDEIPNLFSSSALTAYYVEWIGAVQLTSAEATRITEDAGGRISSSSGLADVLRAVIQNAGTDDGVRIAAVRAAGKISSSSARASVLADATERATPNTALADAVLQEAGEINSSSEKGRVLRLVASRLPPDQALPASYVTAARTISSSSELSGVLIEILNRNRLSPEAVASVLEAAMTISSSSALGEVLRSAAALHRLGDRTRGPFFAAAGEISSSSERASVLSAVVAGRPDPATVSAVLRSARGIGGSSSKAEVLVSVAEARLLSTDALREEYVSVAGSIGSRSERERALRAAGLESTRGETI